MSNSRVVAITNTLATVYQWQGKRLLALAEFAANAVGYSAFTVHLARDLLSPTDFLVDVIEEEFRTETMPHVRGPDHAVLLKRRAEQAFRLTHYRLASVLGRRADGKREDEILLSALTNPELLKPWLDAVLKLKIPLRGIYSVSQLYTGLLKPLELTSKHALIITRQKNAGMRQAFYHHNQLKISRLSPVPNTDAASNATQFLAEVDKTQRYLMRLKLLDRDAVLTVHCISEGAELATLRSACRDSSTLQFRFHPLTTLHDNSKGTLEEATHFSDALFLHLLHKKAPRRDYSSATERRYNVYRHVRIGLRATAAACAFAAVIFSGINLLDARLMLQFNSTTHRLSGNLQSSYERVMQDAPKTPVSPQSLRIGTEIAQTLMQQRTLPHAMLNVLSKGLGEVPQLSIQSIAWVATTNPAQVSFDALPKDAAPVAAAAENLSPTDGTLYQVAQVKGALVTFDGNYRKAFDTVNRLVAVLKKNADIVSVDAVDMPLNTNPAVLLQATTGVHETHQAAEFTVRAVLKVRDHETN